MEDIFYALYKDGSYTLVESLDAVDKLPYYDYIVRDSRYQRYGARYIQYEFIDRAGKHLPLKIGNWELVYLQPNLEYSKTVVEMTYKLYNHETKTVFDFVSSARGIRFFKEVLFPKMAELSDSRDLLNLHVSTNMDLLLRDVKEIKQQLKVLCDKLDLDNKVPETSKDN